MPQDWAAKPHKSHRRNNPFPGKSFYKTCWQCESWKYSAHRSEQEIKASYILFQKQFFNTHRTKPPYKPSYILIDPSIYSIILFVLCLYYVHRCLQMFADVCSMFILNLHYLKFAVPLHRICIMFIFPRKSLREIT